MLFRSVPPINNSYRIRKSPAQLYREELDKQIMFKREQKLNSEKLSKSIEVGIIQSAKDEENRITKAMADKKRKMQQMTKEVYEEQIREHERRRGSYYGSIKGYRPINSLEMYKHNASSIIPQTNDINYQGKKKNTDEADRFSMAHESNQEDFKRVM